MTHHERHTLRNTRRWTDPSRMLMGIAAIALTASACSGSDEADDATPATPVATDAPAEVEAATTSPPTTPTSAPAGSSDDTSPTDATSGDVVGTCSYSFVAGSPYQSCRITSEEPSPLPGTFQNGFDVLAVEGTATPAGGAEAIVGGSDDGFVFAGTNLSNDARLIAVTRGVDQFEGLTAHAFVFSGANSSDGRFTMNWFVGDDPQFDPVVDGESAIIEFECVLGDATESCTYSGSEDSFVPEPDERTLVSIDREDVTDPVDGVSAFTSAAETGAFRAGLVDDNGLRRFTGMSIGSGEFEGLLLAEEGWGRLDGDTFTGTIRLSIIG